MIFLLDRIDNLWFDCAEFPFFFYHVLVADITIS